MILGLLILALACVIAGYATFALRTSHPQWLLYAYWALWLFFPKDLRLASLSAHHYDLPRGVTVFSVLEAVAAFGIVVALVKHRRGLTFPRESKWVVALAGMLLVCAVIALTSSLGVFDAIVPAQASGLSRFLRHFGQLPYRVLPVLEILYALVLVVGCSRFIGDIGQLEPFLWLSALSGVELCFERLIFMNLGIAPSLHHLVVIEGRFNSIVFSDYDWVAIFCMLSICSALYLGLRGRKWGWVAFALSWYPLLGSYQRAPILGVVAALILIGGWLASRRQVLIGVAAVVALVVAMTAAAPSHNPLRLVGSTLGGQVRSNYFDTTDGTERLAYAKRGLDVFEYIFPVGAGPSMALEAMSYPTPGVKANLSSPLASHLYYLLSIGDIVTNPHDIYIEFLVDFGILGALLIVAYVAVVARLFARRRRTGEASDGEARRARLLQAVAFGMTLSLGVEGLLSYDFQFPYFVFILPLVLVALSSAPRTKAPTSPADEPPRDSRDERVGFSFQAVTQVGPTRAIRNFLNSYY